MLACFMLARVHKTSSQRERERERERGREREIEIERERERCRICPELLLLFLKGMTGVLARLSYLVFILFPIVNSCKGDVL